MPPSENEMTRELDRLILGEVEGHMWANEFGLPVYIYFGEPGEELPEPHSDEKLTYLGRITTIKHLKQLNISARSDSYFLFGSFVVQFVHKLMVMTKAELSLRLQLILTKKGRLPL